MNFSAIRIFLFVVEDYPAFQAVSDCLSGLTMSAVRAEKVLLKRSMHLSFSDP